MSYYDDEREETGYTAVQLLNALRTNAMKPKRSRKIDLEGNEKSDKCMTPPYAIEPLLPYLKSGSKIWEPACGTGNLVYALRSHGHRVLATDVDTHDVPTVKSYNFLKTKCPDDIDYIITNPPYSLKYPWIRRCCTLGKPWALLVPVETTGAAKCQDVMLEYGLENFSVMWLSPRINFIMPYAGDSGSAQFPTMWLCYKMLPERTMIHQFPRKES